ncbi:MAG TPA: hypothetical protein VGP06_06215, partial [Janthinobacterium sp.]|nr:hypothetical protein [Janthinobacterium sp.]
MLNKKILGMMMLATAAVSTTAVAAGDRTFNTAAGAIVGAAIGSGNGPNGALVGGLVGAALGNSLSHGRGYGHGGVYVDARVYPSAPAYYGRPAP